MLKRFFKIVMFMLLMVSALFFIAGQSVDYFIFKYRQNSIRKEIKHQIKNGVEESELYHFSVKEILFSDAEWEKPGKEFRLNGSMFDIVKTEFENGKFVFKCINDKQESKLFTELDLLVKKRINENDANQFLKDLLKDYLKIHYSSDTDKLSLPIYHETLFGNIFQLHSAFKLLHSPPPKA